RREGPIPRKDVLPLGLPNRAGDKLVGNIQEGTSSLSADIKRIERIVRLRKGCRALAHVPCSRASVVDLELQATGHAAIELHHSADVLAPDATLDRSHGAEVRIRPAIARATGREVPAAVEPGHEVGLSIKWTTRQRVPERLERSWQVRVDEERQTLAITQNQRARAYRVTSNLMFVG